MRMGTRKSLKNSLLNFFNAQDYKAGSCPSIEKSIAEKPSLSFQETIIFFSRNYHFPFKKLSFSLRETIVFNKETVVFYFHRY